MNKFTRACEMSFNDWLSTIPDVVPEAEYSKNHEKWKKKLFNKMRGDRYHTFTTQTIKVMLVAAVLTTLLLTAFVIPSSREFIIDNFEIFSTYKLTEHNNNSVNSEIIIGYIPDGFELENKENYSKSSMCNYISNDGRTFSVYKDASSIKIDFDTQEVETEEIVISGVRYTYSNSLSGSKSLIWTKNDYVFRINGMLSKEELLKVAETVE